MAYIGIANITDLIKVKWPAIETRKVFGLPSFQYFEDFIDNEVIISRFFCEVNKGFPKYFLRSVNNKILKRSIIVIRKISLGIRIIFVLLSSSSNLPMRILNSLCAFRNLVSTNIPSRIVWNLEWVWKPSGPTFLFRRKWCEGLMKVWKDFRFYLFIYLFIWSLVRGRSTHLYSGV